MPHLFDEITIAGHRVPNRVVMPPMVNFGLGVKDGFALAEHARHYGLRAEAGTGLIIVEAACVTADGRLADDQLGIWDDKHIDGLRAIADAIHEYGSVALVQIHHAGIRALRYDSVAQYRKDALDNITRAFTEAAARAHRAGFDGVELHGAHGYLLSQLASPISNDRTDAYGGTLEGRLHMACGIIDGICKLLPADFIIGYRMGGCEPAIEDGIAIARRLESAGAHVLHVSSGMTPMAEPPKGFPFCDRVYAASLIKRHVGLPVIAVGRLNEPARALQVVEEGYADMAAIGRGMLAEAQWTRHIKEGTPYVKCINCPRCDFFSPNKGCNAQKNM